MVYLQIKNYSHPILVKEVDSPSKDG